ncbi:P-loop containing nucleoside triphosphate hydrolase protein [Polyporus arcularius HHB13444]|uniref:P-loop containing nucleoside triphosphate hydrolase protein n=1 Tax=Polyporus arcularius HHB13444 TaxID=1314778 RepID=A0A5C3NX69_9APHY|nr:P-loop containing nucleoside triphosphate hydrolase protein [Polyporus arcularius HHB13444]
MFKDVLSVPGCTPLVLLYVVTRLGEAIVPAVSIWFQGQFLSITQAAIETRTVDKQRLIFIAAGQLACTVAKFSDVKRKLNDIADTYWGQSVIWCTLELVAELVSIFMRLVAQALVLVQILRGQRDGPLLVVLTLASEGLVHAARLPIFRPVRVWLAKNVDADYMRMRGWKEVVAQNMYRKEFVAGNLADHATSEYKKAAERVGDDDAEWKDLEYEIRWPLASIWSVFNQPLLQLPQFVFILRAAQFPMSIPLSLASLSLVQDAAREFAWSFRVIVNRTWSIESRLTAVKRMYEVVEIANEIPDGKVPFPEEASEIRHGVALEFRNVSFKYPGTDRYALRNISFSIRPGQLCVIVGANGSGKSTILKLVSRLYDPNEGEILLGGHDIRTIKLHDLRQAMSVLFQDYTIFPLSIRDNIAMGDPATSQDDERVLLAAKLAGADTVVDKLPDGYNTYLKPAVCVEYSGAAEGQTTFTEAAGVKASDSTELSGGQMQRLAVARTFMRSVVQEDSKVGLLLFDEPSAALDPAAEHDLFERLRELRGNKTMVFSSHRFGNLTRHADLIMYMDDSGIRESGTHDALLKADGEYARLWRLQAEAFI